MLHKFGPKYRFTHVASHCGSEGVVVAHWMGGSCFHEPDDTGWQNTTMSHVEVGEKCIEGSQLDIN